MVIMVMLAKLTESQHYRLASPTQHRVTRTGIATSDWPLISKLRRRKR
jgi:hypothetical protein